MSVNATKDTIPNFYIFKEKKPKQEFIELCEDGGCMGMQENGYMDAYNFNNWMNFFLNYHESKGYLSLIKRMLLILDGHKSHVTLEVLLKAKDHGLDMMSFSNHTCDGLQPLDISYLKPFKQALEHIEMCGQEITWEKNFKNKTQPNG